MSSKTPVVILSVAKDHVRKVSIISEVRFFAGAQNDSNCKVSEFSKKLSKIKGICP